MLPWRSLAFTAPVARRLAYRVVTPLERTGVSIVQMKSGSGLLRGMVGLMVCIVQRPKGFSSVFGLLGNHDCG